MVTRSVDRQADERRTAAAKGIVVAGASGRDAGTVPAVTSDATLSLITEFRAYRQAVYDENNTIPQYFTKNFLDTELECVILAKSPQDREKSARVSANNMRIGEQINVVYRYDIVISSSNQATLTIYTRIHAKNNESQRLAFSFNYLNVDGVWQIGSIATDSRNITVDKADYTKPIDVFPPVKFEFEKRHLKPPYHWNITNLKVIPPEKTAPPA